MKMLILGGYGVFGGRLAELLSDTAAFDLIIAGRSFARAETFCRGLEGAAGVTPLALDRSDLASRLRDLAPDIVVDASGPFQDYGQDRYAVVRACIAAGIPYLDFADSSDFVFGISRLDEAARETGVFVLSGVSSFPVLTAAVLDALERDMVVTDLAAGVAPSPHAGIGLNVMRAITSYAGAPVTLTRGGRIAEAHGLAESRRYTIASPGKLPLGHLRFSLVDVPDLRVLPAQHPAIENIWIGAGPVPETLHRMLNLLARARAAFGLPSLSPLAPLFHRVLNLMRLGEHRGGMFVHARGHQDGQPAERSWYLLTEGDDGPYIPSMAAEAILRKHLAGRLPAPGARPATGALTLGDYDDLFRNRDIHTGMRDHDDVGLPLYRRVLGAAFDDLPVPVQALHDAGAARRWRGIVTVSRGRNPLARLIARLMGFPAKADAVPVTVDFAHVDGAEIWTRTFGDARFPQHPEPGRRPGRTSAAGTVRPDYRGFGAGGGGRGASMLVPRHWRLLGMPLPRALLPGGDTFECETDGNIHLRRHDTCAALRADRGLSRAAQPGDRSRSTRRRKGRPRRAAPEMRLIERISSVRNIR